MVNQSPKLKKPSVPESHDFVVDRLVERQLLADQLLYPLVELDVVLRHEGDGLSRPPCSRSPPHAVNVILELRVWITYQMIFSFYKRRADARYI